MIAGHATVPFEVYALTVFAVDIYSAYTGKKITLKQGVDVWQKHLRNVVSNRASTYTDLLKVNGSFAIALYCLSMRQRHCRIGKDKVPRLMYVLSPGFMRKVEANGCLLSPEFV